MHLTSSNSLMKVQQADWIFKLKHAPFVRQLRSCWDYHTLEWHRESLKSGPWRAEIHILCNMKWVSLLTSLWWQALCDKTTHVCLHYSSSCSHIKISLLHFCNILNASQHFAFLFCANRHSVPNTSLSLSLSPSWALVGSLVTFHVFSGRVASGAVISCCGATLVLVNAGPGWWMGVSVLWNPVV